MRLQIYLTETDDDDFTDDVKLLNKSIPKIKSQCKPWLNKIKSNPKGIFRGIRGIKGIIKIKPRKERKPLDMSKVEHEEIDKAFHAAFGWRPRSTGLFVTPDVKRSRAYGDSFMVFPIGPVKYLWSKEIRDLYFKLGQMRNKWKDTGKEREYDESGPSFGIKYAPKKQIFDTITSKYHKGMIGKALETRTEIMIQCKEYWAIPNSVVIQWLIWHSESIGKKYITAEYDPLTYAQFIKEALL